MTVKCDIVKKEPYGLEEALEKTGVGKYNYAFAFINLMALISAALEMFSPGVIVATAQCDMELDVYKKGLISSVPMLGVILSAHLWGYIADTRGRKFSLTISMLGNTIFSVLLGFSNNWIVLAALKFCSTACASGTNAVAFTMLGEVTPRSCRSKFIMYTASAVNLTQITNLFLAFPILKLGFSIYIPFININYRPWRLMCQIFGLNVGFTYIFMYFYAYESPKYYFAKGEDEKGMDVLRKIYAKNSGNSPEYFPVTSVILQGKVATYDKSVNVLKSVWNQTAPLFGREYLKKTLLVSYLCAVAYSVFAAFVNWWPLIFDLYSKDIHTQDNFCSMLNKSQVSIAHTNATVCTDSISDFTFFTMAIIAVYFTIAAIISVLLMKCMGKKTIFIIYHAICAVLCLGTNYVHNIGALVLFVGMLSHCTSIGLLTTYAVEMFPTHLRAMGVCLTMMVGRAASFVSINIVGPQLDSNCDSLLIGVAIFIASGAAVALILPGEASTLKKDLKENSDKNTV